MDNTTTHSTSCTFSSIIVLLILRILTFVFLLIALIFISTNTFADEDTGEQVKFHAFNAYRYMISVIIIGFAYNLLQMAFSIFTVVSGKRLSSHGNLFDFFGDKITSYFLVSGSATGFGFTVGMSNLFSTNPFLEKANVSASLLLIGFLFSAIASFFTSIALSKKATN